MWANHILLTGGFFDCRIVIGTLHEQPIVLVNCWLPVGRSRPISTFRHIPMSVSKSSHSRRSRLDARETRRMPASVPSPDFISTDRLPTSKLYGDALARVGRPTKFQKLLMKSHTRPAKGTRNCAQLAEALFNLIAAASGEGSASVALLPHLPACPRLPPEGLARTMHPMAAVVPPPRS